MLRDNKSTILGVVGALENSPYVPDSVADDASLIDPKIGGIPYFFKRCAVSRELFDLIVELRPSVTAGGLSENIKRK